MFLKFLIQFQVGYSIAGSFIFMKIEGNHVLQMKNELLDNRSFYAKKLWNDIIDLNNKVNISFHMSVLYFKNVASNTSETGIS